MVRYRGKLSDLVKDKLLNIIEETGLKPGDQLPSEQQLASDLRVSRPTIRAALTLLETMGYVVRQHGRGTFVTEFSAMDNGLESWKSLSELIKEKGKTPDAKILELTEGSFAENIHTKLDLDVNESCIKLERIRFADEQPVSYVINHFPRRLMGDIVLEEDMFRESLVVLLENDFNVELLYALTTLHAVTLDARKAKHLQVPTGTPSLLMDFVYYNTRDVPFLLGQEWYLDDTITFHIKRYRNR